jgi:hypothetical protein
MGVWSELRADDGRIEIVRTEGTTRLTEANGRPVLDGPADYLDRYGEFGAGVDGEPVSIDFWSNVTVSPDFPSTTEVFEQLYPASGGTAIDGAIAVDVDAIIAQLLGSLFGESLPGPRVLADTLGPAMDDGRIVLWSEHPDDQELLDDLGVSGRLPEPTSDGLAVVSNNAGANKLDAYLERTITYEAIVDEESGEITSTATIELRNDAPTDLPEDVGGNPFDLPPGTNRMYLSVYSPLDLVAAEPTGLQPEEELGWNVYSRFLEIPAGDEVTLRLDLAGELVPGEPYELLLRSQPLANPDRVVIDVRDPSGDVLISSDEDRSGVETLTIGTVEP